MANIDASTPQLKITKSLLDAYLSLNIKEVEPFLSKDFQFQTFPKAGATMPEQPRVEHVQRFEGISAGMIKLELDVHEVIEAPGKVVTHVTCVCTTVDGTKFDYDSLCIFTFVEEDGELKVLELKDFSDPQKRTTFFAGIAAAKAKGARSS